MAFKPSDRPTAAEALAHPWFATSLSASAAPTYAAMPAAAASAVGTATVKVGEALAEVLPSGVLEEVTSSVEEAFTHSGAGKGGRRGGGVT